MQSGFRLFPEQASTLAPQVDYLYGFLIAVTTFFTVLIVALVVGFAIKYRRRPGREAEQTETVMWLELLWTAVPTILVTVMFVWGAALFLAETVPPKGAQDIYVVGRQWMWKVQHPNGRREINELHVPVGQSGEADARVAGRHAQFLYSCVSSEAGCDSRPVSDDVV